MGRVERNTERLDNNDGSEQNEAAGKAGKNYNACSLVQLPCTDKQHIFSIKKPA